MRETKFRVWSDDRFHYWGFIDNGFRGVPQTNEPLSFKEIEQRSQQFTGLHDKNGKEIYEGDIVNILPNYVLPDGVVVWDEDFAGFVVKHPRYEDFCELDCIHNVVTNIYENPDLLEVK